tara:strand:+ start:250 stop:1089 length:840 start_codon:yes stop_codon:yes gene_type:complete
MQVTIQEPLNLRESLESGQAHRWRKVNGYYSGFIQNNLVHIGQHDKTLCIETASKNIVEDDYHKYLRLDDDLGYIYSHINKDERVKSMTAKYNGLRLLRQDPWECLITFICSSTTNMKRISLMVENMSTYFGNKLQLNDDVRYSFPSPEDISNSDEFKLRELGLGFRAPYVLDCAIKVSKGELNLQELLALPYGDAKTQLMKLRGVGPKIADCALVFSLDKLEAFPIDVWVKRALCDWYFPNQTPPSNQQLQIWANEYFGEYAGYSQQYLFHGRRLLNS